ncbi:hypothetical protein JEQ12_017949 [Ovis aries]|uniref:Uncharacterized protein n=1 Tax=Ovis aries TaxID=9940 RepID=A0A836ADH9_SHEEP|nr:hypothetical protein JEQ12_017949 [Ovis aries]
MENKFPFPSPRKKHCFRMNQPPLVTEGKNCRSKSGPKVSKELSEKSLKIAGSRLYQCKTEKELEGELQTTQNVFSCPWTYDQDEATGSVMRLEKFSSPFILIKYLQHGKFYKPRTVEHSASALQEELRSFVEMLEVPEKIDIRICGLGWVYLMQSKTVLWTGGLSGGAAEMGTLTTGLPDPVGDIPSSTNTALAFH